MFIGSDVSPQQKCREEEILFNDIIRTRIQARQQEVIIKRQGTGSKRRKVGSLAASSSDTAVLNENSRSSLPSNSIEEAVSSAQDLGAPMSSDSAAKAASDVEMPFSVLFIDGESTQVNFLMELTDSFNESDNIVVLKLPAACSKTQQPNDVMKGFQIIHGYLSSSKYKVLDPTQLQPEEDIVDVIDHMKANGMDASSLESFEKFFRVIESVVSSAYTKSNIQSGWELTGLGGTHGVNMETIMSKWPGWADLEEPQRAEVLTKISEIAEEIIDGSDAAIGEIYDSVMEANLKDILGTANPQGRRSSSEVNEKHICVNQWRAVFLSSAFRSMIRARRLAKTRRASSAKASMAGNSGGVASSGAEGTSANTEVIYCTVCGTTTQKQKYDRNPPDGWIKCQRSCKPSHFYCGRSKCTTQGREHNGTEEEDEDS